MKKNNSYRRTVSRGVGARGTTSLPSMGHEANKIARQSNLGHYRVAFTESIKATERDIELKRTYAVQLVARYVGVPEDMIHLRAKSNEGKQTLTSLDEVYYVKVGKDNYGKMSIRTQRTWRGNTLIFVYQEKYRKVSVDRKSFQPRNSYKKKTKSQKAHNNRKSYQRGDKRTY